MKCMVLSKHYTIFPLTRLDLLPVFRIYSISPAKAKTFKNLTLQMFTKRVVIKQSSTNTMQHFPLLLGFLKKKKRKAVFSLLFGITTLTNICKSFA